jgi:glycosyltransferase involved in cell wall biosynthesis
MLSVVIATHDSERALLPTLAALVAGAAAGVVREVIIADAGSRDETGAIADGAGCRVLISTQSRGVRLKAAADAARGPWLLFLSPGIVPNITWVDETRRFIEEAELRGFAASRAAAFRPDLAPFQSPLVEAWALLRTALGARPRTSQGLLIAKAFYEALGGHREVKAPERDLLRRIGRRHIVLMKCGAAAVAVGI